jgi:alpha-L-arabinofuranosidase
MEKILLKKSIYFSIIVLLIASCPIFLSSYIKNKSLYNERQSEQVLKISLGAKVKKLPLYGFNGNNTRGPSWTNATFRDSVSSLLLKIIRYPGGTVSDWWDWQNGWFVNDPSLPQQYKNIPYSPTGLKELKLLVDQTGCDVVFTLNMVTKDLNNQIEMLKYAQSLGISIKWIELGNEFYLQNSMGLRKYKTVKGYAQACYQWINNIKSVFPKAKIAVIGGNRDWSSDVKEWNNQVLQYAPNADAITPHVYSKFFKVTDENGINFKNLSEEFSKQYES